jgi:hypothetical protein
MLHMQHAQLAVLLMEKTPQIEFPAEDREHRRQLELVRDSLLRRPDVREPKAHGA